MIKKNIGILSFLLSIFIAGSLLSFPLRAQSTDAGLLPPAVQQFFDNSGNPLSSGKVYFYEVGTTTFKDVYTSSAATTPYTNPITLNAGGKPPGGSGIYGIGLYRQLVKDRNNNTVWDAVTSPSGSGGSTPTDVGDGNLVGTVLPWSGLVAPNQYVFGYGQEISRTAFPEFYTAITQQLNVICSSASNILTGISDTTQIKIGSAVELSLCVVAGTTVVSKTASTVTLSNPSSVSINSVATFFPYGNGNGSTTFNVPDLRGYVIAGRDNMGGTAASRLTSTYFATAGLGATGGLQTATISTNNLPPYTPSGTVTINATGYGGTQNTGSFGAGASGAPNNPSLLSNLATATFAGIAQGGTMSPMSIVQPTITINYIVKVTPDTSTSIATGVYSIGGMTGVISCGTGILCTGNIISFNGNVLAQGSTGSLQFKNADGSFGGSANAIFISPDNLTLGAAGTSFAFDIFGSTSGRVRQTVPAVAGTTNIAWGNTSGTPAVTATAPAVINSTTGNLTIMSGSPVSGGIPYFSSTSVMQSSGLLGANQIVLGGGAGAAPTSLTCASSTTVIHGGTPPTCSQIVSADITANTISNDRLVQAAATTLKGNPTASTASVQDFTLGGLTQTISPGALDWMLIFDNSTGTFKKINAGSIATSAVAGVSSIAGNTGAFTLSTGLTNSVNDLRVDIASASNFQAGTASKILDASVVFTSETTTTYGATTAFDFNTFINTRVTLTGNITTMNCSNMKAGQAGTIAFIQDGTGSRTAAFNTGTCSTTLKFAGATFPTLTTSASAVDVLSYSCRSSSYCAASLSKGYNP